MRQRDYEITIHPDGRVELHVQGYKGKGCMDVVKMFGEIVGPTESLRHTSEYYEPEEEVRFRTEQRH